MEHLFTFLLNTASTNKEKNIEIYEDMVPIAITFPCQLAILQQIFEPVQPWVTTKQSLSNYGYAAKMTYEATKSRHGPTSTPHSGITMGMTTAHCPSQPPCQVTRSCGSFTCCRGQSKFLPSVRCCSVRGKFTVSWELPGEGNVTHGRANLYG